MRAAAERMKEQLADPQSESRNSASHELVLGWARPAHVKKGQCEALTGLPRVGLEALIRLCSHCHCHAAHQTAQKACTNN